MGSAVVLCVASANRRSCANAARQQRTRAHEINSRPRSRGAGAQRAGAGPGVVHRASARHGVRQRPAEFPRCTDAAIAVLTWHGQRQLGEYGPSTNNFVLGPLNQTAD